MSTIISSPGVQINEQDLTANARQSTGLTVAVVGYSSEGPAYEPTMVSSISELEDTFGAPTNAAERYMYHSARQVLSRSLAQALVVRLPYDNVNAVNTRNVLAYPVSANNMEDYWGVYRSTRYTSVEDMLKDSTEYTILPPVSMLMTQEQYEQEVLQKTFSWEKKINVPAYGDGTSGDTGRITTSPTTLTGSTILNPTNTSSTAPGFIGLSFVSPGSSTIDVTVFSGPALRQAALVNSVGTINGYTALTNQIEVDSVTGLIPGLYISVVENTTNASHLPANTYIVSIDSATNIITTSADFTDNYDPALGSDVTFGFPIAQDQFVWVYDSTETILTQDPIGTGTATVAYRVESVTNGVVSLYRNDRLGTWHNTGTLAFRSVSNSIRQQPAFPIAMFVVDTDQGSQNNLFEGTYIGITDNSELGGDTGYQSITSIKAVNGVLDSADGYVAKQSFSTTSPYTGTVSKADQVSVDWGIDNIGAAWTDSTRNYDFYTSWTTIPSQRLDFNLTSNYTAGSSSLIVSNSISETVEKLPASYPIHTDEYKDTLIITAFKLKKSIYSLSTDVLANSFVGGFVGSLDSLRKQNNATGGPATSYFLEDVAASSNNSIELQVNPYISTAAWTSPTSGSTSTGTIPDKSVRVHGNAKSLFSVGTYSSIDQTAKKLIGNLPGKLDKALKLLEDSLTYPIDVIIDAGLSTMWSVVYNKYYNEISTDINDFVKVASYNDEDGFPDTYIQNIGSKIRGGGSIGTDTQARLLDPFRSIHEYFTKFAGTNRKDLIYIADPLRQIFVKGRSYKVEDGENFNFSSQIFWPLYHLFENTRSSYVCSYANWVKVTDSNTARSTWIPSSGAVAGVMMASDQNTFPWTPVAGFNRGTIDGLLDVGISPSQRDRDLLYKISMNPIANFTNDGIVIFGQKTMFTKPSAFDRINVRRLFITLEKYVSRAVKYFVFEPNTYFTRSRIVSTLRPLFDNARQNDGLYDYRIVCDERNNTPDVIDNNQLKVDIYIKPTRTAEFILVNFFATRTDQNFDEILPL